MIKPELKQKYNVYLSSIVCDGKGGSLVFRRGVSVSIFGGKRDGIDGGGGVELGLQSLEEAEFSGPEGLTLIV